MAEPDPAVPASPTTKSLPRVLVAVVMGGLAALLAFQLLGSALPALGAFLGAGVVAGLAWGPLATRSETHSLGGAAVTGVLALLAAYVVGGLAAGGAGALVDHEAAITLLFSFWIVVPVMVGAAVGLALLARLLATRD